MCVATVTDAIGDNVLIHFDGWTNDFDYYCLSSSYLIHPVGWCNKNGRDLTPPEGRHLHFICRNAYRAVALKKCIPMTMWAYPCGNSVDLMKPTFPVG